MAIVLCLVRLQQLTSRRVDRYRLRGAAEVLSVTGAGAAAAALLLSLFQLHVSVPLSMTFHTIILPCFGTAAFVLAIGICTPLNRPLC